MDIWSYMLGAKQGGGSPGGGGEGGGGSNEDWIIGDGNTHIWITLPEGRTSPMLGVGVNGTVTVDWGDGTEPDVLTGTSTSTVVYTPNHAYAKAGDYVITLSGDGTIGILGQQSYPTYLLTATSSGGNISAGYAYANAIKKVEIGNNVINIGKYAFWYCYSLSKIVISDSVTSISTNAFSECHSLYDVVFHGNPTISSGVFSNCNSLSEVVLPKGATTISVDLFKNCYSLVSIVIPDGVTSIQSSSFYRCTSATKVIIPASVLNIGDFAFQNCYSVAYYDFSNHTSVPTLSGTNAFSGIPADCEIRVPAALVDEWKAATNWSTYADYIVRCKQ